MGNKTRSRDWLKQAENDYLWGEGSLSQGFYAQTCFIAQQVAEKAIKSIAYFHEYEVKGHSIAKIAKAIGINSEIEEAGKRLDMYYISARYPDALPAGSPFEFFSLKQAQESLADAKLIIQKAKAELHDE